MVRIPRVSRPPVLEDFLKDTPREAEATVEDFRQREPGDGIPVSQRTSAYLSYDQKHLYVVFVCEEEQGKVRARHTKREWISADDLVIVYLDTFLDRKRAFLFGTTPLGTQFDGILDESKTAGLTRRTGSNAFDTLFHSRGVLTKKGFVVWMAIPFKSLRFPERQLQTWGIALGRGIRRTNERSFWPYITLRNDGFVPHFAKLEGLEGVSPGHSLEFIPYGSFTANRFLKDREVPDFVEERTGRAGLDSKIVLNNYLTLDLTLNPDFNEVESDAPQVTANRRFEVFFPEKRPFFIENFDFFQTEDNLFFSRRIRDPEYGARLSGTIGTWKMGALAIDDRAAGIGLPLGDERRDQRAGIAVLRAQKGIGRESSVGFLITSRDLADTFNRVLAVDSRLRLNSNWTVAAQVSGSDTKDSDGERLSGSSYLGLVNYSSRHGCTSKM